MFFIKLLNILKIQNTNVGTWAGTLAEWSRALAQNHLKWTVQSLIPCEGCYRDGELSLTPIDGYVASDKYKISKILLNFL